MKSVTLSVPVLPARPPLGAQVADDGVLFRVYSRHATRLWVMLFDHPRDGAPVREVEFTEREGDVWGVFVKGARAGQYYALRADGPHGGGAAFRKDRWLLDPYALAVAGREKWGAAIPAASPTGMDFPKGLIVGPDDFDWGDEKRPCIPLAEAVVYETSVRGFTVDGSSGVRHPGTYRGIIEKIPHLKRLGVNVVELLPVHEFDEMEFQREGGPRKELRNFWGYSTLAFFAPMARYGCASDKGEHLREFKEMVKALHAAGIEVMLDVVFNHTAEGGPKGPTYSFRGLDNEVYYMLEDDREGYRNYTGCGNTVNCNHPAVNDFIVDCLRYWAREFHVDGFRFDLATILTRGQNGEVLGNPPVVERIAEDPVLRGVKLVAEAWDAAGCYQVGSFPNRHWSEWNGRYRDDMRAFWRGDEHMLSAFATRLCGSSDLYDRPGQSPLKSINFFACHDGFTLADITSYERKHNLANCEENRDGDNNNHSSNGGKEGETKDPAILRRRERRRMNMLATLFLSQGVPMMLAGDEFGRTQKGNNNAYCQDNAVSWVDWKLLETHGPLCDFTAKMIAFRKAHPALRRASFLAGAAPFKGATPDIRWYGPDGAPDPDWGNGYALACRLDGHKTHTGAAEDDEHLYMIFNSGEKPATFILPLGDKEKWRLAFTTQDAAVRIGRNEEGAVVVKVDGESVTVFTSPLA